LLRLTRLGCLFDPGALGVRELGDLVVGDRGAVDHGGRTGREGSAATEREDSTERCQRDRRRAPHGTGPHDPVSSLPASPPAPPCRPAPVVGGGTTPTIT